MYRVQSSLLHKLLAVLLLAVTLLMCRTDAFASEQKPSEARLAQLLAPVALYPDSLLTHILIASTYPLEVVEAERWRKKNKHLGEELLVERADDKDWDPSIKALLPFPGVLERMNDELEWTSDLGDAFLADESGVLDMVQQLRLEADEAGNLNQMENVTVTRVEKEIIIESASPRIVYVPYYDPRVVYPYWRWSAYPPIWWSYNRVWYGYRNPGQVFYWRPGINISFNFFFGSVYWHKRHVVVHRHGHYHHRPHYRHRVASSHGAKRWHHNPHHRKGIRYADRKVHDRVYREHNRVRVSEGHKRVTREFKQHRARDMQHRTRQQLNSNYRGDRTVYKHNQRAVIRDQKLNPRPSAKQGKDKLNRETSGRQQALNSALKQRQIDAKDRRQSTKNRLNSQTRQKTVQRDRSRYQGSKEVRRSQPVRQVSRPNTRMQSGHTQSVRRQSVPQRSNVQRSQVRSSPARQAPRTVRSTPRSRPSGNRHSGRERRH